MQRAGPNHHLIGGEEDGDVLVCKDVRQIPNKFFQVAASSWPLRQNPLLESYYKGQFTGWWHYVLNQSPQDVGSNESLGCTKLQPVPRILRILPPSDGRKDREARRSQIMKRVDLIPRRCLDANRPIKSFDRVRSQSSVLRFPPFGQ